MRFGNDRVLLPFQFCPRGSLFFIEKTILRPRAFQNSRLLPILLYRTQTFPVDRERCLVTIFTLLLFGEFCKFGLNCF